MARRVVITPSKYSSLNSVSLNALVVSPNPTKLPVDLLVMRFTAHTRVCSQSSVNPTCDINVHGKVLEWVQSFVYLGSLFTSDARCEKEIRRRIEIAKYTFTSMKKVLISSDIHIAVLKCYVWSHCFIDVRHGLSLELCRKKT